MIAQHFLSSARQQFSSYKNLAEKAIAQLDEKDLYIQPPGDGNSMAIIMQHMAGNMLSRWTDFLTTDGEKDWRKRDNEFEVVITNKDVLMQQWEKGWTCLFNAIDELQPEQLQNIISIRQQPQTVLEAIHRQLTHYAYHVGQLVFYAKQLKGENFSSLSIPKIKREF